MVGRGINKQAFLAVRCHYWICLLLVLATLGVYRQVRDFEFINYDDYLYIVENRQVLGGLNQKSIAWALGTTDAANWHPVTWLSHLLDTHLFGLNPGPHHLTSLLIHIVNTILLFLAFRQMTAALWPSAFVAALFSLHPLHVEAVAQVACRKDLLSTFFLLLTLLSYSWYARRPAIIRYLLICIFFALGLMAKPMLVTLPFVLLLLDYWPLGRFPGLGADGWKRDFLNLVWEKLPLFFLTIASVTITFLVQSKAGAVASLRQYPFIVRVTNALVSYTRYIVKTIWPSKLAVFYPHPGMWPWWQVAGAVLLLSLITLLVIWKSKRKPYLAVGWLWYIGTLVPVIGLVQLGSQAMADRYTYVPLIGLFIMAVWGATDLFRRWRYRKVGLAIAGIAMMLSLMAVTRIQAGYWRDDLKLFSHAVEVTSDNLTAHNNLGMALKEKGRTEEAIMHYQKALRIDPGYAYAHNNWGNALSSQGNYTDAAEHYKEAIKIYPRYAKAYYNLGNIFLLQSQIDQAIGYYLEALRIDPFYTGARNNLGTALAMAGRTDEAIIHFREALQTVPEDVFIQNNLTILTAKREMKKAVSKLKGLLAQNPENPRLHFKMGRLYKLRGNPDKAIWHYQKALSLEPAITEAFNELGNIYLHKGEYERARLYFKKSIARQPDSPDGYYFMAGTLARQNRVYESIDWLRQAVARGFNNWDLITVDRNLEAIRETAYYQNLIKKR